MTKERFCWNCGASMGFIEDRYYERHDVCGKRECVREAREQMQAEIEEAHRQLDEDFNGGRRR